MPSDPYDVLGVTRDADDATIRRAWETRVTAAMKSGNLRVAQSVDAAYECLRDPFRRAEYDRTGVVVELPRIGAHHALPPEPAPARPAPARSAPPRRPILAAAGPEAPVVHYRRRRPSEPVIALVLVLVVAVTLLSWFEFGGTHIPHARGAARTTADFANLWVTGKGMPPIHPVHPGHRLRPAVTPPSDGRFIPIDSGRSRWDPCRPIHYVVSGTSPIPGGDRMLRQAIKEVSRDTGLVFVANGATTEVPVSRRAAYQPQQYGATFAPVLIAWTDAGAIARLTGNVAGLGGADPITLDQMSVDESGIVYLDAAQLLQMSGVPNGRDAVRGVIRHELGHLVGLAHVHDKSELMYPEQQRTGPFDYTPGDLRGLAWAGAGPCATFAAGS